MTNSAVGVWGPLKFMPKPTAPIHYRAERPHPSKPSFCKVFALPEIAVGEVRGQREAGGEQEAQLRKGLNRPSPSACLWRSGLEVRRPGFWNVFLSLSAL